MTEKLQQTIKEEVIKLPKETQDAISSIDWTKIAEDIGKRYLLDDDEVTDLQVETLFVLVGLEDVEFFATNIENNIVTSKDTAEKMANEALEKIFIPIADKIVENIKKNQKDKNANAEQNLNFILSGGDYSAFIAPSSPSPSPNATGGQALQGESRGEVEKVEAKPISTPNLQEIKDKLSLKQ